MHFLIHQQEISQSYKGGFFEYFIQHCFICQPSDSTLLQGLTLISGTQTGCRRLDSYIEQKKFLACGPEFSVEFSAPPELSAGVTEKYLSTGWARTFDLQFTKQILYHCATAPLYLLSYNIYVLFARIFRPFL
jgi:hypothetical protein